MENEKIDNELVVKDVPETSEQQVEQVQVDASENEEQVQKSATQEVVTPSQEDIEKQIEERANKLFEEKVEQRLIRDRINREKEDKESLSKYRQLENIMKAGLGVDNLDDAISKSSEFYKGQGINIPTYKEETHYSERDEKVLAEADAKEIISCGKREMETEANRIASIPESKRTFREKTVFNELCKELFRLKDIDELKAKGYETDLLSEQKFIDFRNQFNINTPISQICEMYNKINGKTVVQPKSPGSAKTNNSNNEIKEYYTPEEVRNFTEEDLDNPKLMAAVERSMQVWSKNK